MQDFIVLLLQRNGFLQFFSLSEKVKFTTDFDFLLYYKERQLTNQTLSKHVHRRLKCIVRTQTHHK